VASAFSHAVVALSIGSCFYRPSIPKRFWAIGAACSVLPDLDVIGFRYGVPYGAFWGHRGFTHSLTFAALLVSAVVAVEFRRGPPGLSTFWTWLYLFLATATHGVLDAMTDGGLGVAFFSPFDNTRYFLPWTPIRVSPIGFGRFFTFRGLVVIQSELLWIWLPAGLFAASVWIFRRGHAASDA
jgi:inner membrane protein